MNSFRARPTRSLSGRLSAVMFAAVLLALSVGCGRGHDSEEPAAPPELDLATPPPGVVWRDYQGVQLPIGDDGPRVFSPTAATGFRHNPQGAALAAIVHKIRMSIAPDEHWADIARHELAMGPGKDHWLTSRVLLEIREPADPAQAPRVRGYTLTSYTPARAHVDIYTEFPDRSVAVVIGTVVWTSGDWWLELPPPESREPQVRSVDSVTAAVNLAAPQ